MRWKSCLTVAVYGALLVAGCGTQHSAPAVEPVPGHMAPGFSLKALNDGGKTISLNDLTHNDKPILLNAFASWCEPCQQETPDLVRMASKYAGKIQFVGVNMTQDDSAKDVDTFVKKFGIKYPVLSDPNGDFMNEYDISGFPTTFLLNSKGKVISVHLGALTEQQLQAMITQALGK
ncbi:TlpA family protein disulfide reductase [Alicyclobacillus cycloheptanicus]|uniref:Thiol-disulfide isomerase/thioredoxin n=1 Tax=Alicyclobacillus cycloheptanicus TaxID=1457 RepID=A0ABT9XP80_9BACL|nr:TlpA disulfide reductase family protein [Alicyclobacillus cycloheptanicus]MDQ0191506.1 thiol-disulfide isomerase/thioredoxin [Alicyclobacillus cycloheptanicus]WDL99991.1 TlpA family protein disulfide reductase [Alicyclobacillus cycloheptanicus]